MPKLKTSANEQMDREVRAALTSGQIRRDLTDEKTAKALGISKQTYQRRKREPECISIGELRRLVRLFKISDAEILRMIRSEES